MAVDRSSEKRLIEALKRYLGVPLVCSGRRGAVPEYPYVAYSVRSGPGGPAGTVCRDGDEVFWQSRQIYSFTVCTGEVELAMELAEKAQDWFTEVGKHVLADLGFALEKTGELQNRDVDLTVDFERRWGFEMELAVMSRIVPEEDAKTDEVIETVKLESNWSI